MRELMLLDFRVAGECTAICDSIASASGCSTAVLCVSKLTMLQTTKDGRLTVPLVLINWYVRLPPAPAGLIDPPLQGALVIADGTHDAAHVRTCRVPASGRVRTSDRDARGCRGLYRRVYQRKAAVVSMKSCSSIDKTSVQRWGELSS